MARRRAQVRPSEVAAVNWLPPSARVAWAYLAVVIAAVATGLLVVVAQPGLAQLICGGGDSDAQLECRFGVAIWVAIGSFIVVLAPAVRALKLDWWLWLTTAVGASVLLMLADAIGEWWWWLSAGLLPAVAALLSADWERGASFRRAQLWVLGVLAVAALVGVGFWLVNG